MIYTIYSYWNITELTGVFNAIAALVGSPDFAGAIRFFVLVAMMSLAMVVLSGRARMDEFWQWTLMVALLNGFLLAPKATVQLVDVTGTNPPAVISNVPIGLAAVASSVSTMGHWLTTAYETVYALPGDLNFEANGMMFGQRVQQELRSLKPATIAWQNDFNNYYSQCLAPDILSGALTQDQINTSSNIWSLLGSTNPGLYVTLSTVGTVSCPSAYADLNTRLTTTETPTTLQQYAVSALPQATTPATAVNAVSSTIVDSTNYFYGISTGATAAAQQGIVSNSIIDAHCNMLSQSSNTALATECMTQSEGFRQSNSSYVAMANIAQSSMPKLRNAIELIQYAVFPLILIFVVVGGSKGLPVLKNYVMSLVWIQLWPPLYAVVNYMMNVHAAYWGNATQGNALTLQYQQWITSSSVSDQAIAGMLVVAIPAIAGALVKGGEVGMQAVGNLASPPHSVEKLATQMTSGNENLGQINAAPSVTGGAGVKNEVLDNGGIAHTTADHSIRYDKNIASDNANFKAESGTAYSSKIAAESKTALADSHSAGQQAGTQLASNWNEVNDFMRQHGHDTDLTKGDNVSRMADITNANQAMQQMSHTLQTKDELTQSQATSVSAMASAGIDTPIISAKLHSEGMSQTKADHAAENATQYATSHNLTQQTSNAIKAVRGLQFSDKNSSGAHGAQDISAGFARAQTYQETAANELRRSEELAHKAELVRTDQHSLTNDRTTQVVNSIIAASQEPGGLTFNGQKYKNMHAQDIDELMRNGDPDMQATVNAFSEKLMDADVEKLVKGKMLAEADINADYEKGSLKKYGEAAVAGANAHNQGVVSADQAGAGVRPGQQVGNPIVGAVTGLLNQTSNSTKPAGAPASAMPVMPGAMPSDNVSGAVSNELNNPGTVARAFENAASSVVPDATSHLFNLFNKHADSGAYFEDQAANRYKGSDTRAVLETLAWGVGTVAMAIPGGGIAESLGIKAAEKFGVKAAESAAEKGVADGVLAKSTQEATDAGANLATKQAEAKTAEAKYTATEESRFGPNDLHKQTQLSQDRLAMKNANTDVEAAAARSDATQEALKAAEADAHKAAEAASADAKKAAAEKENIPKYKDIGRIGGGVIGMEGGKEAADHFNEPFKFEQPAPEAPAHHQPAPAPEAPASTGNGAGGNDELTGSFGKSNLGNLLGGGQAYVPQNEQPQPHASEKEKGELPPPSN